MNPEKFVPQRIRRNIKKFDLTLRADAKAVVLDLTAGQAGLAQQRIELDPRRPRARAGESPAWPWICAQVQSHPDTRFDFGSLAQTSKSLADDNKMLAESRLYASAAARQRNLLDTILRKKRPLLSRLNQAYVSLALIPEDTDGSRTVSLARYGAYEVRLVEFPPSRASDAFPFWLKLYRRDIQTSLDSRCCQDLDHAEAVAEHLVSRAKQLHRAHAGSPAS